MTGDITIILAATVAIISFFVACGCTISLISDIGDGIRIVNAFFHKRKRERMEHKKIYIFHKKCSDCIWNSMGTDERNPCTIIDFSKIRKEKK